MLSVGAPGSVLNTPYLNTKHLIWNIREGGGGACESATKLVNDFVGFDSEPDAHMGKPIHHTVFRAPRQSTMQTDLDASSRLHLQHSCGLVEPPRLRQHPHHILPYVPRGTRPP